MTLAHWIFPVALSGPEQRSLHRLPRKGASSRKASRRCGWSRLSALRAERDPCLAAIQHLQCRCTVARRYRRNQRLRDRPCLWQQDTKSR
ncbi:hypothetical protein V2G26_019375 [Clonostachys chloroleuca]